MMTATGPVTFGYNTPAGDRGIERIEPRTFVRDLSAVCDVASQFCSTFWVPDHFMRGDTFRLECWTQLTWLAARYPTQRLGGIVMANSYRHPPLLAKMAASIQTLSSGRFILGYGAGWLEDEYHAYGYPFPPPAPASPRWLRASRSCAPCGHNPPRPTPVRIIRCATPGASRALSHCRR